MPFYEEREEIIFTSNVGGLQENETLTDTCEHDLVMGMNDVFNEADNREMHFVINGRDGSTSLDI